MKDDDIEILTTALRDPGRYEVVAHPDTRRQIVDWDGLVLAGIKANRYLPEGSAYVFDKSILALPAVPKLFQP